MRETRIWCFGAAVALVTALGGCASTDDTASKLLVAQGDYDLYSCPQVVNLVTGLKARKAELEKLMARAETDIGGKMMSAMGYRPDYLRVIGELKSAETTMREKHCEVPPPPAPAAAPKAAAKRPKH
jgi:hypothetical protein